MKMSSDSDEFFDAPQSPTAGKQNPFAAPQKSPPKIRRPPEQLRHPSLDKKNSDGMATPRPHGVHIAFQPPTPTATPALSPRKSSKNGGQPKPEKSGHRRRKLDGLRHRMQDDFEPESLGVSSESASDATSICSWGRHFLAEAPLVQHQTTVTEDRFGDIPSSSSAERYNTADNSSAGGSGSKSNSLERGLRGAPSFNSSNSMMSREYSMSIDIDEPEMADLLRRKNSEAAEIIELLTSEIVHGVKIERDSRQRNASSSSTGRKPAAHVKLPFDEKKSKTIPVTGSHSAAMEEEKNSRKCTSLDSTPRENASVSGSSGVSGGGRESQERQTASTCVAVAAPRIENGHKQPDIVASAVGGCRSKLKMDRSPVRKAEPVAPPRRHKRHTYDYHGSPGGSGTSTISSDQPASAPILDSKHGEHLKNVMLKDLDSGRQMSLADVPGNVPSMDPITCAAWRRMSIMNQQPPNYAESVTTMDSDDRSSVCTEDGSVMSMPINPKTDDSSYLSLAKESARRYRRSLGKKMGRAFKETANTVKTAADEVTQKIYGAEEESSQSDEEAQDDSASEPTKRQIRVRARHSKKGPFDFEQMRQIQTMAGEHSSAVWSLKFSVCGRLLASAGQDNAIRIWVLKDAFEYFNDMRLKYNLEAKKANASAISNVTDPLLQTIGSMSSTNLWADTTQIGAEGCSEDRQSLNSAVDGSEHDDVWAPFMNKPFCMYKGHTADVLDIAWSKSYFLLSSSMDRTVRLWHISRTECLCVFQHIDFVTSIAFLPRDDKFFLSGSLDGKLRVWNITEKKVALWNEVEGSRLITALAFVNNGKYAVVGTFDGKCFFYTADQLKYHTTIDVKSTRGKNARGHKITGLAVYSDRSRGDKLLVTSNDSRIRLYDLSNLSLTCKYKGASNYSSQIRANFSPDGRHVICGSEDRYLYVWRTSLDAMTLSVRKDRNGMWERVRAHASVVTAAIFAPKPELIFDQMERAKLKFGSPSIGGDLDSPIGPNSTISAILPKRGISKKSPRVAGDIVVSADFQGNIMVFMNRTKVKTGGSVFFPAY